MISITTREAIRLIWNLFLSARVFPYGMFLITLFPIFAVLVNEGYVGSLWSLLRILPFVFAMCAGFTYNTVCDAKTDPKEKNPISRGDLSKGAATKATSLYAVIAIILILIIYENFIAFVLFMVYLLLWLAYSGLGVRFKESVFAPVVASFVLWTGPSLILLSAFEYSTNALALLLSGLFAIYVGHEIKHTVIEHDMDRSFGLRTFAVLLGKRRSTLIEYCLLLIGYALLLISICYVKASGCGLYVVFFSALFAISFVSTVNHGRLINYEPRRDNLFVTMPYISTKVFLIAFGLLVLGFSALLVFFIAWLFLLSRYP